MRHLHARDDPRGFPFIEQETAAHGRRDPRGLGRESLTVHRVRADCRSRRRSRTPRCFEMRAHPAEYELVAPGSLSAVLSLLARDPGKWLPIAGGTDVMVQYSAGKLPARKRFSIWNLPELRRIEDLADEVRIGAGCTYTDLREHAVIQREFALLEIGRASWRGRA